MNKLKEKILSSEAMQIVGAVTALFFMVLFLWAVVVASWALIGIVVSWCWNTFLVAWFPQLPVIIWWQAAIILFVMKLLAKVIIK